jgi:chromate reductase
MSRRVAVLVGSLRKGSFNRQVADAVEKLAPAGLSFERVEIGDLAFYNEDLETDAPPPAWTRFREALKGADAVLIVTPEYNRSIPAVLKNAIDVGSRPWGKSLWGEKPMGVITASLGPLGGYGANHHIRQGMVTLNAHVMAQPEAYLGTIQNAFAEDGSLKSEQVQGILTKFGAAFAAWIEKHKKA